MRVRVALFAALLGMAAPASADELLAGGAIAGVQFYCTFYNAGRPAVTLSRLQLKKADGTSLSLSDNTCDDAATLQPGKNCLILANTDSNQPEVVGCRAMVSPSKDNVRGVMIGGSGSLVFATDLR